jgi:cardiolipin synthase
MHRLPETISFKTRAGIWVSAFVTFLLAAAILCILLVRRETVEYYLDHKFNVRDAEFFPSAHALADPLPVTGNKIELLHNGQGIFPAMLEAIRGAQKSVNFEAFLFHSGEVGSQFRDALAERARAGVRVRVLLDGMGSSTELDGSDVKALKEAGCSFAYYHAVRSWRIDRMNRRTHRRVLVVDGRIGFTGGVGFSDEWQGDADAPEHWREVHARLEGPIVGKLQAAFQEHWFKEVGETLSGKGEFPELVDGIFSVLGSSNFDARSAQINEELDITIYDEAFGREMQAVFERDLERSKRYTLEDFEKRSLWDRFTEWLMLPFHSQI